MGWVSQTWSQESLTSVEMLQPKNVKEVQRGGFEDGEKGPSDKKCGGLSKVDKARKQSPSQSLQKEWSLANIILAHWDLMLGFWRTEL